MGILQRSAASLGFYGDDLDPTEITTCLGIEPTVGVRKGSLWRTARGIEKVSNRGSWRLLADDCQPGDLDSQIKWLLSSLSSDIQGCRRLAESFRGRVFCGLFLASSNEGLSLSHETLSMLAERRLTLDLDIYGYKDDAT
jgi:hypothetical protein